MMMMMTLTTIMTFCKALDLINMIVDNLLIRDDTHNLQEINMLDLSAVERQMALNEVSTF